MLDDRRRAPGGGARGIRKPEDALDLRRSRRAAGGPGGGSRAWARARRHALTPERRGSGRPLVPCVRLDAGQEYEIVDRLTLSSGGIAVPKIARVAVIATAVALSGAVGAHASVKV